MDEYASEDGVKAHLREVGLICSQWAHLEWMLEVTNWWVLGFLDKPTEGRIITASLGIELMARRAYDLCHLKQVKPEEKSLLESVKNRIAAIVDERNLAVHGVRQLDLSTNTVFGHVGRGNYKNTPQKLPLIRLASLNDEIAAVIQVLHPWMVSRGLIEDNPQPVIPRQSVRPGKGYP